MRRLHVDHRKQPISLTFLFRLDDVPILSAARERIREGFRERASLPTSDPAVEPAIKHAEEVARFLRTNVVQGKKDGDVYSELTCASAF